KALGAIVDPRPALRTGRAFHDSQEPADQLRAEPRSLGLGHGRPARLRPAEAELVAVLVLQQIPGDGDFAVVDAKGAIFAGVGTKLVQAEREQYRQVGRHLDGRPGDLKPLVSPERLDHDLA